MSKIKVGYRVYGPAGVFDQFAWDEYEEYAANGYEHAPDRDYNRISICSSVARFMFSFGLEGDAVALTFAAKSGLWPDCSCGYPTFRTVGGSIKKPTGCYLPTSLYEHLQGGVESKSVEYPTTSYGTPLIAMIELGKAILRSSRAKDDDGTDRTSERPAETAKGD